MQMIFHKNQKYPIIQQNRKLLLKSRSIPSTDFSHHKLGIISTGDLCSLQNSVYIAQNLVVGFPGGSEVKKPPTEQEKWVWSQGQEDALGKDMATPPNNSLWKIPWTEEPGEL